jgi:homoserine kinase type II
MAVYTHITEPELRDYLQVFPLPPLQDFSGIAAGVSNTNYLLRFTDGLKLILTIFEERTPTADLPYYMALMEHLAAFSIPCPRPLRTREGEALHEVAGRVAAMVSFVPGQSVLQPDAFQCAAMGTMLALMHRAVTDFPLKRANSMNCATWIDLLTRSDDGSRKHQDMLHLAYQIAAQWPLHLPAGAVHADLFPDNVFFADRQLCGVIDFYFACHDLLAYDLAIALNAWCVLPNGQLCPSRARSLLHAYHAGRPLQAEESAAMPLLLQAAALRFYASRHFDLIHCPPNALVTPKDPAEFERILAAHRDNPLAFQAWLA